MKIKTSNNTYVPKVHNEMQICRLKAGGLRIPKGDSKSDPHRDVPSSGLDPQHHARFGMQYSLGVPPNLVVSTKEVL